MTRLLRRLGLIDGTRATADAWAWAAVFYAAVGAAWLFGAAVIWLLAWQP